MRAGLLLVSLGLVVPACGARTGIGELLLHDAARPREDAGTARDAAGIDAPGTDAFVPPDVAPPCRVDSDCDDGVDCTLDVCGREGCAHSTDDTRCDDGLFCDGIESCSLSGCVMGTVPCNDAVDCTHDRCLEASDDCAHDPDDALCPLSNTCDPIRGCEPRLLAQDPTSIYNIALPSGEVSRITRTDQPLTDIALAGDGTFYGATTTRRGAALVRLDPRTGATTPMINLTGRFVALEADPGSDILYGGSDDVVVRFDLASSTFTNVARLPAGETVSGDFAFIGGRLLVTATRSFGVADDDLFAVDVRSSGTPTLIGSTGHRCIWGLAVYRDTLYGLTCDGLVLTIDPTTAASTIVSRTSIEFDGGAAR